MISQHIRTAHVFSRFMISTLIVIVGGVLFSLKPVLASEITFMTHSTQESVYHNEKGELRGKEHGGSRAFFVELVRKMMIRMNTPSLKIEKKPFKRALIDVQTKENYALFMTSRVAEREETVQWVGPITSTKFYFYEAKHAPTGIQTLEEAKTLPVVVMRGSVYDTPLAKAGFTRIYDVADYATGLKMVLNGRVPLTVLGDSLFPAAVKDAKLSMNDFVQTPVMLFQKDGYIVFSNNVPKHVIQEWQDVLDQMKQEGEYDRIYEQYYQ